MNILPIDKVFDNSLPNDVLLHNWEFYRNNRIAFILECNLSKVMNGYGKVGIIDDLSKYQDDVKFYSSAILSLCDNSKSIIESVIELSNLDEYKYNKVMLLCAGYELMINNL